MQVLLIVRERENRLFLKVCKYLSGIESRNLAEPRGTPLHRESYRASLRSYFTDLAPAVSAIRQSKREFSGYSKSHRTSFCSCVRFSFCLILHIDEN